MYFCLFAWIFRTRCTINFRVELWVGDGVVYNDSTVIPTRSEGYHFLPFYSQKFSI